MVFPLTIYHIHLTFIDRFPSIHLTLVDQFHLISPSILSSQLFPAQNVYSHFHQNTSQGDRFSLKLLGRCCVKGMQRWQNLVCHEYWGMQSSTLNWWFDLLFAEDCCDSDGCLHHVYQGKLSGDNHLFHWSLLDYQSPWSTLWFNSMIQTPTLLKSGILASVFREVYD